MDKKKRIITIVISLLCVIVLILFDQISKNIALNSVKLQDAVSHGEDVPFIKGLLSFSFTRNKGAAWGMFQGRKWLLVSLSAIASIAFLAAVVFWSDFSKKKILQSLSIIFITSGAIGNLIDRAFFEDGVIDFLKMPFFETLFNYSFPIFNVADSCMVIGCFLLIISVLIFGFEDGEKLFTKKEEKKEDEALEEEVNG